MEDVINRLFDKLENADVSPSANYSMPEYYMHCAMRGREREKRTLFNWISMSTGIDVDLINKVFNERYNNVQNESRNMRRTIRLREGELRQMIAESVRRVLNEWDYYNTNGGMNAGYSGRDGYGNPHGYVSRDEAQMRSVFQRLKNYGIIGYNYFEDWKRAGYPHANEV